MTQEEFMEKIVDVLNLSEPVDFDTKLDDLPEWDSLAYVAFISMTAKVTKKRLRASEVRNAETMRDLYELVNKD